MFQRERQGTVDVIRGADALIVQHLEQFAELLRECLDGGQPKAVLDLHQVPLIDSAGLELLVDFQERLQQLGGALKLAGVNPLCSDVLDVTGIRASLEVFPEVLSAVGSFVR